MSPGEIPREEEVEGVCAQERLAGSQRGEVLRTIAIRLFPPSLDVCFPETRYSIYDSALCMWLVPELIVVGIAL